VMLAHVEKMDIDAAMTRSSVEDQTYKGTRAPFIRFPRFHPFS